MRKIVLVSMILMGILFAIEPATAIPKNLKSKTVIRHWPSVVKPAPPHLRLRQGVPPQIEPVDFRNAKLSLRPFTAEKLMTVQKIKVTRLNHSVPSNRAEMLASYKSMLLKQQAEAEIQDMARRGASDEEIEAFKLATDEKILTTRYNIMKTFGTEQEIEKANDALMKLQTLRKQEEEQ